MTWRDRAACLGRDDIDWFPAGADDPSEALAVCATCPVLIDCRLDADRTEGISWVWGIRAGETARHRSWRRRRAAASTTRRPDREMST